MEKNLFDQVWERLRVLTGWRKDREMAEFLEITPATVAGFRKRGTFPEKYAFKIAAEYNVSAEWVLTGSVPGDASNQVRVANITEYEKIELEKTVELAKSIQLLSRIYYGPAPRKAEAIGIVLDAFVEASRLQSDCHGLEAALRELQTRLRETEAELEECKKKTMEYNGGEVCQL